MVLESGLLKQGEARAKPKPSPKLAPYERRLWRKGFTQVAGVDEVGRGPLAGPVVAAAVILPNKRRAPRVNDSKILSDLARRRLFRELVLSTAGIGVGVVWQDEIDRINILQASLKAMIMAIADLDRQPDYVLVDGTQRPDLDAPTAMVVDGDQKCFSIAAASIVAKVIRDNMMIELDNQFPQYGFHRHKGYATEQHRRAIKRFGPCQLHRRSFSWGLN